MRQSPDYVMKAAQRSQQAGPQDLASTNAYICALYKYIIELEDELDGVVEDE